MHCQYIFINCTVYYTISLYFFIPIVSTTCRHLYFYLQHLTKLQIRWVSVCCLSVFLIKNYCFVHMLRIVLGIGFILMPLLFTFIKLIFSSLFFVFCRNTTRSSKLRAAAQLLHHPLTVLYLIKQFASIFYFCVNSSKWVQY